MKDLGSMATYPVPRRTSARGWCGRRSHRRGTLFSRRRAEARRDPAFLFHRFSWTHSHTGKSALPALRLWTISTVRKKNAGEFSRKSRRAKRRSSLDKPPYRNSTSYRGSKGVQCQCKASFESEWTDGFLSQKPKSVLGWNCEKIEGNSPLSSRLKE